MPSVEEVLTPRAELERLSRYVPRVAVEWLVEEPQARWRPLEGTMAFVDISGFTRMSELLASLGKAGAEEVTEAMNATFARLLDVAYEYGGGLVKFGGDALLLFFDGAGHEARAAAAAFGMRKELRSAGRVATSAGAVTLKMHVGVHTDRFDFFLVGDRHLELIVTGPAATRTVLMEATAEAGEIVVSPATAAALERAALGEPKGEGLLLRARPAARPRPSLLPDLSGLPLEQLVPEEVRAHVATPAIEPEHRTGAVAFVHFGGVDALLAEEGPEAVGDALAALVGCVQHASAEHGVCFLESDIDRDGGKIVLVAGAPSASENDEERLLRTARAVVETPSRLELRIGVSRGRLFAGEVGGRFRRTYTILGGTAALAARLAARAEPGSVLAAFDVVSRSETLFETAELPPFTVKGRTEPVRALRVGPVVGTRAREHRRLELVGRERELAILAAALAPVRAGFASFVEIVGDPGLGKSRLVEEVIAQADGFEVFTASCGQYEAATPYFAFRDLLRAVLGVPLEGGPAASTGALRVRVEAAAPEVVPWLPLLAAPLDAEVEPTPEVEELQPAFRRARLHGVVTTLLRALLPEQTMLVFEDVHWMDEASSELLRHLGTHVPDRPWFVCISRRDVAGGFAAADRTPAVSAITVRLEPLAADAALRLAAAAAQRPLAQAELAAITDRAGGNPLFLQELLAAEAVPEAEQLPETVEAVVAARIDRLELADRTLLRWASVLGSAFPSDLLADVLEEDAGALAEADAWERLVEFVERDPDVAGGFRFRHALIRDAAYDGLPYRRRQELHARVGRVYEQRYADALEEVAQTLSLHFARARDAARTWRYSLLAGARARAKYANPAAADFYRRALEAAPRVDGVEPEEVASAWTALADVCLLAGQLQEATAALAHARKLVPTGSAELPELLRKEGHVREVGGRYSDALRWYARARRAAEALPNERARRAHLVRLALATAAVRCRQGAFLGSVSWCRDALAEASRIGDRASEAHAYYLLHLSFTSLGRPERAEYRGLAVPIYEELGDLGGQAKALNNMGVDAYYEGRWDDALELWRRSQELMTRVGDVIGAATLTNNIGEILSDQGRLDEAVERFEAVVRTCDAAGELLLSTVARANLGRAAARGGSFDEAERMLIDALEGFRSIKAASFEAETQARFAELAALRGRGVAAALGDVDDAGETTAAVDAMLGRVRGYALLQQGEHERALEALEQSLAVARRTGNDYEVALTLNALAEAGSPDAEACAAESGRILERLGVVSLPRVPLP